LLISPRRLRLKSPASIIRISLAAFHYDAACANIFGFAASIVKIIIYDLRQFWQISSAISWRFSRRRQPSRDANELISADMTFYTGDITSICRRYDSRFSHAAISLPRSSPLAPRPMLEVDGEGASLKPPPAARRFSRSARGRF